MAAVNVRRDSDEEEEVVEEVVEEKEEEEEEVSFFIFSHGCMSKSLSFILLYGFLCSMAFNRDFASWEMHGHGSFFRSSLPHLMARKRWPMS